jgi:RND family efflux transporter MFP subunit
MKQKLFSIKTKLGKWFWAIIILVVLVVVFVSLRSKNKNGSTTAIVQKGLVTEELILTGQVKAEKHATLYFPVSGKIAWVGVAEGQTVPKGQALVSLDKTVLNVTYQQALNSLRNYQAAAESALDGVKGHSGDETYAQKATRTAAESARDSAYDALKAAEYNLKNSTILAPFAGVITSLPFSSPGVNVTFTDPQVEIIDPKSICFEIDADQSEVINIKENESVLVTLDSYTDTPAEGRVEFIGLTPKKGETGAVYRVKVVFTEKPENIFFRVGMTGDAKFVLSQKEDALFVLPRFVNSDKNGKFVYLGKKSNKVRVTIGIEGEERVEIKEGVKEGDILYD